MDFSIIKSNFFSKIKKFRTFIFLSLVYISLITIILLAVFKNYIKLTKEKILFQETEVIKSLQKIVDYNFLVVFEDVNFINSEIEMLIQNHDDQSILKDEITRLFYYFAVSKKNYLQIEYIDTTGNEIFKINFYDSIPEIKQIDKISDTEIDFLQKINMLSDNQIITSKVSSHYEKVSNKNVQVINFGTPLFDTNNKKLGILIFSYKFSDLIEIFNEFSIENEGKLLLVNKESKILISDNGKNNWFSISNDSIQYFFNDSFPQEWENIRYNIKGNHSSEKGLFIYNTLNFSSDNTTDINFPENSNKWKIISIIDSNLLKSIIWSNIIFWVYILAITSVVVLILLYMLARNIRMRKNAFNEVFYINNILKTKNEEIKSQRDTLQVQSVKLEENNKILKHKQLKYEESLNYAQKIQSALLPTENLLSSIFSDYFIVYLPKSIVSGDFYWADRFNFDGKELIVFAIADCTGHGIPGAFVSVLGISLLNEISHRNRYTSPNQTLEEMRKQVKYMLKQKSVYSGQEDSIDMALCFLDKKNMQMQYAGANRPMIIIDKNKSIKTFEPTDNPIGVYMREIKFRNNEIELKDGDAIYLFTDGVTDQFNTNQEKYKLSRLKQFIIQTHNNPAKDQKTKFQNDFENWKSDFIQIDDVLLMGIKV